MSMKNLAPMFLAILLLGGATHGAAQSQIHAQPEKDFIAWTYHDVRDDVYLDLDPDRDAVNTQNLIAQLEWLLGNGFNPVSVEDILIARDGGKGLPKNAVLLTVDDGLKSVYDRIFPLLKLYRFPALVAVVTSWTDADDEFELDYGGRMRGKNDWASWDELREMSESGLVEIACHSNELHRALISNPQGNRQPAATTREYEEGFGYESEAEYEQRIREDLGNCSQRIAEELGQPPRVMVWPYGDYNATTKRIAGELGMVLPVTLTYGANVLQSESVDRANLIENPEIGSFVWGVRHPDPVPPILRLMDLDLADLENDPNEEKLGAVLERIYAMTPTTVVVKAYREDASGNASSVYFPNRHLQVREDLLNRVAWTIGAKAQARAWVRMPITSYDLPGTADPEQKIREIIDDLARLVPLAGIIFDDDTPQSSGELAKIFKGHRPHAHTGRVLYPAPNLEENARQALEDHQWVVIRTAPLLRGKSPTKPLEGLLATLDPTDPGFRRTIFELSTLNGGQRVPVKTLTKQIRFLQRRRAASIAYIGDDFLADQPPLTELRPAFSAQSFPYPRQ